MPESVTNPLCDSRMKNIDDKLDNINLKIIDISSKINLFTLTCEQVRINTRRLDVVEKWKDNFSFTKVLVTMSIIAVAITTIYNFLIKVITHKL